MACGEVDVVEIEVVVVVVLVVLVVEVMMEESCLFVWVS